MRIKKLTCASWIGLASVFTLVAQAADPTPTVVPAQWNVDPWNATGPTLETFESPPTWVPDTEASSVDTGLANRTDRFWGSLTGCLAGNQLVFSTLGITNTFSGATIQPGAPIFIDMRCKLNPFASEPDIDPDTKLCFYMNADNHLVVATASDTRTTTSIDVNSAVYYPIMIRFAADKFDVFFNGSTEVAASLNATATQLSKMVISGDGEMDDLYVSYGDPRRTWINSLVDVSGIGESPSPSFLVINENSR